MVLFGYVFTLRVFFFFLSFYLGLCCFEFLSFAYQKKKKKCIYRLDLKILAFCFKIIRCNQSEEFIMFVICELYLSLCLLG